MVCFTDHISKFTVPLTFQSFLSVPRFIVCFTIRNSQFGSWFTIHSSFHGLQFHFLFTVHGSQFTSRFKVWYMNHSSWFTLPKESYQMFVGTICNCYNLTQIYDFLAWNIIYSNDISYLTVKCESVRIFGETLITHNFCNFNRKKLFQTIKCEFLPIH